MLDGPSSNPPNRPVRSGLLLCPLNGWGNRGTEGLATPRGGSGITFASPLVHQPEALGAQALIADLEVVADMGAAASVFQALVGLCDRRDRRVTLRASPSLRGVISLIVVPTVMWRPVNYQVS